MNVQSRTEKLRTPEHVTPIEIKHEHGYVYVRVLNFQFLFLYRLNTLLF